MKKLLGMLLAAAVFCTPILIMGCDDKEVKVERHDKRTIQGPTHERVMGDPPREGD